LNTTTIGILGAGRMGYAIASTLVHQRILAPRKIGMADPSSSARRRGARLGCRVTADAYETARQAETILLAVKPQKVEEVAALIGPAVRGKRVISILAGATRSRLRRLLHGARIVRVMPNTPLLVAQGAIVIARDGVSPQDLRYAVRLFSPMGGVWIAPEKWMNAVTALSGSGPALFCAFLEAGVAAASSCGLPARLSEELAVQTLAGTARLLQNGRPSGESPSLPEFR
jgi:pyrroline-5-carboxylate reductase